MQRFSDHLGFYLKFELVGSLTNLHMTLEFASLVLSLPICEPGHHLCIGCELMRSTQLKGERNGEWPQQRRRKCKTGYNSVIQINFNSVPPDFF